jgi:hypothetical protein
MRGDLEEIGKRLGYHALRTGPNDARTTERGREIEI